MTPDQMESIRAMLGEAPVSRQSAAWEKLMQILEGGESTESTDTEYALDLARQEAAAQQGPISPYQKIRRQAWIDPLTGGQGDLTGDQALGRAVAARDAAMEKLFGSPYGEREVRQKPMAAKKHSPGYSEERERRFEEGAVNRLLGEPGTPLRKYRDANQELADATDIGPWSRTMDRLKEEGYPWGMLDDDDQFVEQGIASWKYAPWPSGRRRPRPGRADEPGRPPYWTRPGE